MAKSQIELEYQKELNRINRFIKQAEKRGFTFGDYKPPKKPKTVTKKSVQTLKRITPTTLYSKASYYDPITQTRMTGKEGKRLIRSRAQKSRRVNEAKTKGTPPSDVDDIITNVEELITGWQPISTWTESYANLKRKDTNILKNILTGAINSIGREQVARNCQRYAALVKDLAFHICYGSSDFKWNTIEGDITAIAAIIYGRTLDVAESRIVEDAREQVEYYEEPE